MAKVANTKKYLPTTCGVTKHCTIDVHPSLKCDRILDEHSGKMSIQAKWFGNRHALVSEYNDKVRS